MRLRRLLGGLGVLCGLSLAWPPPAQAQFNPGGRRKGKPAAGATKPGKRPKKPKPGGAPDDKGDDKPKGPSTEALITRYTNVVLAQPGAQFPLQRLAQLYRERDGKLDALLEEFEKRATKQGPEQWNAQVALAGLYRHDGRLDRAVEAYEQAIAKQPKNAVAILALAHLLNDRGDKRGARERFEQALPHVAADADKEQTLRTLMSLSLELGEWDAAKQHHEKLVARARGSFYVRGELGRELMLRGEHARAVEEYREVVKAAAGDNRVLAPALRDLGAALSRSKQREEALTTLKKALQSAGSQSGVRREIHDLIVEVYRAEDRLRELVEQLEKENPGDFERLRVLAALYEETGQVDKALVTYKKALAKDQKEIGTRLKVVQLLQIQGELDEAIKEYEALIRAAPRNPDFTFQLAEALIQRGDRDKALEQLKKLEARSGRDEETLAALVDFYERVEEKDRALALLQKLSASGATDPRHVIELGDRYFQEGDKKKALQVWQRIKTIVPNRARAASTLGEVYLDHDMPGEALAELREAVKLAPRQAKYKKALALGLERTGASGSDDERRGHYEEARKIWEGLLKDAGDNQHQAREARQHIVSLWSLGGQLQQRVGPLGRRLAAKPPDLEAGRLLAEIHIKLRQNADAQRALEKVIEAAPGDVESLTRLELVLAMQRKPKDAIGVLERLVKLEPKRAREYYQRMAQYAAELYLDDDAIQYAARAVELSPDDAEGHRKLGEMYRRRQDMPRAVSEFRQAIARNERLFLVYFQLAELLIGQGQVEEADRLLRRVVRSAPDEELIAQAARLSMQVNLGRGTLESLEKELLPVALGNPQKPLYRRLLVEIYGAMAFPLVHRTRSSDANEAREASSALSRIGERAVKPLLDALGDDRDAQQRVALELLAYVQNKSASPALFAYATGTADSELRIRAMIAAGAPRDPAFLPKLESLLAPGGVPSGDESDPVVVAAAWSVARMRSPKAQRLLVRMLDSGAPSLRALGALGLGLLRDRRSTTALSRLARDADAGPLPRAAAAFALGELDAKSEASALAELGEASDTSVRAAAVLALARLGAAAAPRAIAEALVSGDSMLEAAAVDAALVLAAGSYRAPHEPLAIPESRIEVRSVLDHLRPLGYGPDERAAALARLGSELERACTAAARSSPERARAVADALLARDGAPAFGALTRDIEKASPERRKAAEEVAERIAAVVVAPFVGLAVHPEPDVRIRALAVLAPRSEPAARGAVARALRDPDASVRRTALAAVARWRIDAASGVVVELLGSDGDWPTRVRAADTLGALGSAAGAGASAALVKAAESDAEDLVREAAVRALHALDPSGSRATIARVAAKDPEPRVREAATALLGTK